MSKTLIVDENDQNYYVEVTDVKEDDTLVVTSTKEYTQDMLKKTLSSYAGAEQTYSRQINEQTFMRTQLTEQKIEQLAYLPQDNLTKVQEINNYIDFYINKDDIIGRAYETIVANLNSNYTLSYPAVEGRNRKAALDRVKERIDQFNEEIEIEALIQETIPYAYANGNRVLYLRKTRYDTYQVDRYPLGMVQLTNYKVNNEPVVAFNLANLGGRITGNNTLIPTNNTTLTNFTFKMFPDLNDEIRENFPREIYRAYVEGSGNLIRLNTDLTGVIRTNNRGKRYGVSPIFKALSPALRLEIQEKADSVESRVRAKKIIFQKISSDLLGEDGEDIDLAPTIYSHGELVKAFQNEVVLYTGAPWVDDVKYVEPKANAEHSNLLNYYRSKVLSALGISFLNGDSRTGMVTANISLAELMKEIDKIGKQLSKNINKWYKKILADEGMPIEYAPTIEVLDSELLELELRMSLVEKLFNLLGMSYEGAYNMLGVDFNTEKERRSSENEENLDTDVFFPRMNANTFSAKGAEDYENEDNRDRQNPTINETVQRQGGE